MISPPSFLADAMVGRLGKWLRLLGFDCASTQGEDDRVLLERARREGRILLTRDSKMIHELCRTDDRCWLLSSWDWTEQLREVVSTYHLEPHIRLFSRCSDCNATLEPVDRESIKDDLPPRSYLHGTHFARCTACGKLYWRGDHTARMMERLRGWFPGMHCWDEK